MTLYLNIGSNLGNRLENIDKTIALLMSRCEIFISESFSRSSIVESSPWGYDSPNDYLNQGVSCALTGYVSPEAILDCIKNIENKMNRGLCHRDYDGTYKDRYVDIDIIAIDDMLYSSPSLIIPHEKMHLRPFVLKPMSELAPDWVHPRIGKTAAALLKELEAKGI